MTYNVIPTDSEIEHVARHLKFKECGFANKRKFIDYMLGDDLHYFPILISNGSYIDALIYFDKYDPALKTCNIHFITAKTIANPLALMRQSQHVLDMVVNNGDIDMLFAFIPNYRSKAVTIAKLLGFKEFKKSPEYIALCL